MRLEDLAFPAMSGETAGHLNLIARRLRKGQFMLGGSAWRFSLTPAPDTSRWPSAPFVVGMEWGGASLSLAAPRSLLALLCAHVFPQTRLDVLPEPVALAGFELVWSELGNRLEPLTGRKVRLARAALADPRELEAMPYRFVVSLDSEVAGDGLQALLCADGAALALLALLARRVPERIPDAAAPATPIRLQLELGEMHLPMSALRTLATHDLLVPDNAINAETPELWLRADACHIARARLQGGALIVESILEKEAPMSISSAPIPDEDLETPAVLDELEVRLTFDLGYRTVRLADLAALSPGQILPLDAALPRLVSIRVNRQLIGRGELVRVDDAIAVRVLEMAAHDPAQDEAAST